MRRGGFTFIEALITLALLSIALGVVATLIGSVNRAERQSGDQGRRLVLVLHALEMMRAEVQEATEILPTPPSSYRFRKLSPSTDTLLQNPASPEIRLVYSPDQPEALVWGDTWDSRQADHLMTVSYLFSSDGVLNRQALWAGQVNNSALCEGVSGFRVYRDSWNVEHLEVSVMAGGVLRAYSAAVGSRLP